MHRTYKPSMDHYFMINKLQNKLLLVKKDKEKLDVIKKKLPNCYICNLDGKVIIE